MWTFLAGIAVVLVVQPALLWLLYSPQQRKALWNALVQRWRRMPPPPPPPPPQPAPPPVILDLAPLFGNIREVPSEREPDLAETDELPLLEVASTRFQDLNWRLIAFEETAEASSDWPTRAFDDFPMLFRGRPEQMMRHVRKRVRGRYPVIIDWDGHWHAASVQLERTPNLRLPLLDAYLGLAGEHRPVVVSRIRRANIPATGVLQCLRFGFQDYTFPLDAVAPYPADALANLLDALTGPPDGWLWFSVARMRASVLGYHEQQEALRSHLEAEAAQSAAIQHENRFAALWKLREAPTTAAAAPAPAYQEAQAREATP